jgi:hypothetical protein
MSAQLSRRSFLSTTLAAVSTSSLASPLGDFLTTDAAAREIFSVLQAHLHLTDADRHVAAPFLARLRTPGLHTESPATFDAWMNRKPGYEHNLAAYILEEFVVCSNYLAAQSDPTIKLKVLPA